MTAGEYMAMDADEIENYGTYTAKQELIDLKIKYKELVEQQDKYNIKCYG